MAYTDIDKPTDYFETVIYVGGTTDISSLDFQPDFVWGKKRTGAENHALFDSVRGATKTINSNTNAVESTRSGSLTSFDSDGFTMGGSDGIISSSGNNYVAWNWKAGGSASSNSNGSITSTVSANTTSGFSIVSYTGSSTNPSTVGHGLGTAPAMIIVKNRSTSGRDWVIWHKALGGASSTADLLLFTTDAKITSGGYWGSSAPSSTTFGVGNTNNNNANGNNHIAYCFAEKKGYSKFGSYTGNGNADGTFVYTGFSPSFVLLKETSNANNWMIFDNKRSPFNLMDDFISPDISDAESTGNANNRMDMLSNGFKIRGTGSATNRSGSNFIFMAFAKSPFTTSTGIPTTAR